MRSWNELVEAAKTDGFSVQLMTGDIPVVGYMVAVAGHEVRIPIDQFNVDALTSYVRTKFDALMEDNMFLGAWFSDGHVFLDVSENVSSLAKALFLGTERNQLAVWDVVNSAEISTVKVRA